MMLFLFIAVVVCCVLFISFRYIYGPVFAISSATFVVDPHTRL